MSGKNFSKEEVWDLIVDLVTGRGEFSDMLNAECEVEEIPEGTKESLLVHMIAHYCAVYASMDKGGAYYDEPVGNIMGQWAFLEVASEAMEQAKEIFLQEFARRQAKLN